MKKDSEDIMDVGERLDIDLDFAEYLRQNPNAYNKYIRERGLDEGKKTEY